MAGTVEERLGRIEDRLFALERQVRAQGAWPTPQAPRIPPRAKRELPRPTPVPQRPIAIKPVAAPPTAAETPAPSRDWERFLGIAVLGRIGVAAVLLAAAYFAKLAYVEMSDTLRVVSIYGLAAAFVGAGFLLERRVAQTYVALLWGGGTAAAYLAGVAARLRYDLVDALPALGMLLLASGLGQYLARRVRLQVLASVALAGAFAAPLLIASPVEDRTGLMIYLLALHGWSAWVERAWGWMSARFVGIAGTLLVGGLWLLQFGSVDVSTYIHIELYVLGLIAPELVRLVRGIRLSRDFQTAVAVTWALAQSWLLIETAAHAPEIARWPILVCGIFAAGLLALCVGLAPRAGMARNRHLLRSLSTVAWISLSVSAWLYVRALPGNTFLSPSWLATLLLTGIAGGALALRKRLGAGEAGALAASILSMIVIVGEGRASAAFALLPAALVGPAALLLTARRSWVRCLAAWTGFTAVLFALLQGQEWHFDWVAGSAAGCALWLGGAFTIARRRADHALARNATAAMAVATFFYVVMAIGPGRPHWTYPALFNGVSAAALVIALMAGMAATHHATQGKRGWSTLPLLLWIIVGTVLLVAGGRATRLATIGLASAPRDAWMLLYLSCAGVAFAAVGRWRLQPLVMRVGLGIVLCAGLFAFQRQVRQVASAWVVLSILAPVAATAAIALLARARDRWLAWGACGVLGALAATWGAYVFAGRFPVEHALLNLRFVTALGILAAGFGVHRSRAVDGLRRDVGRVLVLGGAAFGFVVGLLEVREAVQDLDGAWPDVLVSVYATLYAAGLLILGFFRKDTRLRYAALALFGGVVVKVGLHDLATADRPLRILVTGVLGLVLLAAAFAYARRKEDGSLHKKPLAPHPR